MWQRPCTCKVDRTTTIIERPKTGYFIHTRTSIKHKLNVFILMSTIVDFKAGLRYFSNTFNQTQFVVYMYIHLIKSLNSLLLRNTEKRRLPHIT